MIHGAANTRWPRSSAPPRLPVSSLAAAAFPAWLFLLILLCACGTPSAPPKDVCAHARIFFLTCGASVPVLESEKCAGVAKAVARCVVEHARDCDELANLASRLDDCRPDGGDDDLIPAAEDLPFPFEPRDAGRADAGT